MFGPHIFIHILMSVIIVVLLQKYFLNKGMYNFLESEDKYISSEDALPSVNIDPSMPASASILNQVHMSLTSEVGSGILPSKTSDSILVETDQVKETHMTSEEIHVSSDVTVAKEGSSVWCSGTDHTNRMCRFRNLCYFPQQDSFVFLQSQWSILEGVPADRFSPALLDMSSVQDHNAQYFNYIDFPADKITTFKMNYVKAPSLIMRRFHSDNLMHILHDDLLPLMHTLHLIFPNQNSDSTTHTQPFKTQIVFMDDRPPGDFFHLYEIMSSYKPVMKEDLNISSVTCFHEAYVGISKATTWYQYGFLVPQGPIPGYRATAPDIWRLTNYMCDRLNISKIALDEGPYITLVTRKHNRFILNEVELSVALTNEFKMRLVSISIETHTVAEMIAIVQKTTILIGVHGSLLSLAMFLHPGSVLIELFPYAVNPDNYTPYHTLTSLPGMDLIYKSWKNMDVKKTVTHPDDSWETGGIIHLPREQQEQIKNSKEVPPHLCCRDPEWLFRIYQDTYVDIPNVLKLIHSALKEKAQLKVGAALDDLLIGYLHPAPVADLSCLASSNGIEAIGLFVSWEMPWNIRYFPVSVKVQYEVWLQEQGQDLYSAWMLSKTWHQFTDGLKKDTEYHVWVRCVLNTAVIGPFNQNHVTCKTT